MTEYTKEEIENRLFGKDIAPSPAFDSWIKEELSKIIKIIKDKGYLKEEL